MSPCIGLSDLTERIHSIPQEDQKKIERLFQYLFWDQQFVYTLFGSKPIGVAGYHSNCCVMGLCNPSLLDQLKLNWSVWQRYQHLFPSSEFQLFGRENGDWLEIYIMNKPLIKQTIHDNLPFFRERFEEEDEATIFQTIWDQKSKFDQSHAVYGILLGYGKENSLSFERFYSSNHPFELNQPKIQFQNDIPMLLPLPYFINFCDEETADLLGIYEQDRKVILDLDWSNCLEKILGALSTVEN